MHMGAASSAAAAQAPGRSARVHSQFRQPSRGAPSQGNLARGPRKPAPSRELLLAVRVVFRTRVRPYLQEADESDPFSANPAAAQLKVYGGSNWKNCREQGGCQKDCAALRAEIGWPVDLTCVDPNDKGTSIDTQRLRDFLLFAKECGWINEVELASQATRYAPHFACLSSARGCMQELD